MSHPIVAIIANDDIWTYNLRKEIIEEMLSQGFRVALIVKNGPRIKDLEKIGCEFVEVAFNRHGVNPIYDIKLLLDYWKVLEKLKPCIVLTFTIKPNVYGGLACQMLKIPYIPNVTGLGSAIEKHSILQPLALTLYRLGLHRAKKVFFQNSENMNFFIRKKLVKNNFDLLPGSGVNLIYYSPTIYPPEDNINFVFIGRIMKEKGIDQYLEAAQYIKKKYHNTHFHICGFCEENYADKLQILSSQGIIIYHGMVNDMREMLKNIHCTIHPTYYPEGLSNVLLESCACGRPIITTNRSGCREVAEDGVNGYIVREKDGKDLIDKIEMFLALSNEDRKIMGLAGRAKVEREFNRQVVVDAYMGELDAITYGEQKIFVGI